MGSRMVGKTIHKSSFNELLLLPVFIVLRPPTLPCFLPSDLLVFLWERLNLVGGVC